MNHKKKPVQTDSEQNHLSKALDTFEETLEILHRQQASETSTENLPVLPLPSLLDRCQAISVNQKRSPKFLVCFPGTPQLNPVWWQGRVRFTIFMRLPVITGQLDQTGRQAMIDILQADTERRGCDLVLLATPDEILTEKDNPDNLSILTCHPWTSFVSDRPYTAQTLEDFCAVLQKFIVTHPKSPQIRLEELGKNTEEQAVKLINALGLQPVEEASPSEISERQKNIWFGSEYIDGGSVYKELCASLGYDEEPPFSSSILKQHTYRPLIVLPLRTEGKLSRISGFLPRVNILNRGKDPARIAALIRNLDFCLEADDFVDQFDKTMSTLSDENGVLFMILAGAHFSNYKEERLQSLSMLTEALDIMSENEFDLRALAATVLLDLNEPELALSAMTKALEKPEMLTTVGKKALDDTLQAHQKPGRNEHGHAVLIDWININPPRRIERKRLMVEIGTTRENVPGQGSTRKLGLFCAQRGIDFVTVDMDPRNTLNARKMFRRLGLPFQTITAKGEEYLAQHKGPIDYIFLDAYDFDHGQHSEVRQNRYERQLGSRINDDACHQMHLECAQSLLTRLSDDGIICFDDTWIDDSGAWSAKGETAVPFLLNNGFKILEARDRAALLDRKK